MPRTPAKPNRPKGKSVVRLKPEQEAALPELPVVPPVDPYADVLPWQRVYGDWLTGYAGVPAKSLRLKQASTAAGYQVKSEHLDKLEKRQDFRDYCARVLTQDVAAARTLAEAEAYRTIQQWSEMRDVAYAEKDYKEFAKYANPILDRVWPKSVDVAPSRGGITIVMGQGSFAAKTTTHDGQLVETTEVLVLSQPEG